MHYSAIRYINLIAITGSGISYTIEGYCTTTATSIIWGKGNASINNSINSGPATPSSITTLTIEKVSNTYCELVDSLCYCYTYNGICYLQLCYKITQTYSGWVKVGKVNIKPINGEVYFAVTSASNNTYQSYFRIGSDGYLYAFPNSTSNTVPVGNCSFVYSNIE